jgi:phytoene desaturase
MTEVNKKALKNPKLVQLFNRSATYNGSNPYVAPGILNIIPHLEFGKGAFFPENGMHSITTSLYQHALKLGVEFNFDTKIEKLETRSGKIQSASFKGESIGADIFVSNMDVFPFYKNLLPNCKLPEKVLNQERSSSALIFYWGIKKEFKDLILHNILFSENYEEEFNYIFNKKEVYDDPTIYLNISSKHNPSDAPKGKENWFVMINVPSDNGQNWNKIIASCKATILAKINRILKVDVTELIEYENILHPQLIQNKTSSYKGALYGSSSNNKMAAFFRHPNFSRQFSNLYFCGGSVHPGGGIPLALSSAKIVSELID